MGDTIEVIDGLDSDSTTDFSIFGLYWLWDIKKEKIQNKRRTYDR